MNKVLSCLYHLSSVSVLSYKGKILWQVYHKDSSLGCWPTLKVLSGVRCWKCDNITMETEEKKVCDQVVKIKRWKHLKHLDWVGQVRCGCHIDLNLLLALLMMMFMGLYQQLHVFNSFVAFQTILFHCCTLDKKAHPNEVTWWSAKESGEVVIGKPSFCFSWTFSMVIF